VSHNESIEPMAETLRSTEQMPVLSVGHGRPMNAIEAIETSRNWRAGQLLLAAGRREGSR
jgi:hypothetical protein